MSEPKVSDVSSEAEMPDEPVAPEVSDEPTVPDKPTLLLVEDEDDTADLVTLIMEGEGYQVLRAADGREAIKMIESLPPPALVLLDMLLPFADGVKILDYLKCKRPAWKKVPVVMLTADSNARDVRESLELGAKDYILKPFKRAALIDRLRRFRNPDTQKLAS